MSDNWIRLIPEDPRFVPNPANQVRACERFSEIAPQADEIKVEIYEEVQFVDCGANMERILCPSCRAEIPTSWWSSRMSEDYTDGFKLSLNAMPCCGAQHTLHQLIYEWPQGFGLFVLDAMNPDIGRLSEDYHREFEEILGTKLRVIYQHI